MLRIPSADTLALGSGFTCSTLPLDFPFSMLEIWHLESKTCPVRKCLASAARSLPFYESGDKGETSAAQRQKETAAAATAHVSARMQAVWRLTMQADITGGLTVWLGGSMYTASASSGPS